jgi:hypothetical protein
MGIFDIQLLSENEKCHSDGGYELLSVLRSFNGRRTDGSYRTNGHPNDSAAISNGRHFAFTIASARSCSLASVDRSRPPDYACPLDIFPGSITFLSPYRRPVDLLPFYRHTQGRFQFTSPPLDSSTNAWAEHRHYTPLLACRCLVAVRSS